jgi:large subunit ribosomal protein L5
MATTNTKSKLTDSFAKIASDLGIQNKMAAPTLEKVVVSTGVGSITDRNKLEIIPEALAQITGQKPAPRQAKKSIAAFRSRQGDTIGYQITLRGEQMQSFVDKLINIALPRTKDFRGIKRSAVDQGGNLTIGIREHTIFPETSDEDIRNIFGFGITLVSNLESRESALKFFEYLGIPFVKGETNG